MQGSYVIADDAPDDGPAEQQPILRCERAAGSPGLGLGLVGDHLGGTSSELDYLRPLDEVVRQPIGELADLRLGEDPDAVRVLGCKARRSVPPAAGSGRLEIGEDGYVAQASRPSGRVVHDQLLTSSADDSNRPAS